jgi:5-hmdU DNA kinase, helical domain
MIDGFLILSSDRSLIFGFPPSTAANFLMSLIHLKPTGLIIRNPEKQLKDRDGWRCRRNNGKTLKSNDRAPIRCTFRDRDVSVNLYNLQPTIVFESYWKFAAERHRIYLKRLAGSPPPWTNDPILEAHKFTNTFRAADRVSQYCIRQVIYGSGGSMDPEETVFRVLLFKFFNTITAWETLTNAFGPLTWRRFDAKAYGDTLGRAWKQGAQIWPSRVYVQNQNYRTDLLFKHERYLALLEYMMRSGVTKQLQAARTYEQAFNVLRVYPLHKKAFIPMQHLTDINYSPVINFDEDDFIAPGGGAIRGINKCFDLHLKDENPTLQDLKDGANIIRMCVDGQEGFLEHFGEQSVTLCRRRLHSIDAQNLFCECDKFSRIAHPQFTSARSKAPKKLQPLGPLPQPFFPPKWGL